MNKPRKPANKSNKPHAKGLKKGQGQTGNIRIIAGKYRGRKLPVLLAEGLRPTTDRVKETVFNWLMPYINDSHCLDCFSGSGSLGFEAASRGANQVTFLEMNKQAAEQLKQNSQLLKADNVVVHHTDALLHLAKKPEKPFDLVFIDPPFRKDLVEKTSELINNGWLATDALIYVEMESETTAQSVPSNWTLLKEKVAGQVAYRLYQTD